ncbi:MAG: hypothetical protein WBL62_10515 [Gallionella sp.]
MNPNIESEQSLLNLSEDAVGGVIKRAFLSDAERHVKILAMLKARDQATRSDVESVEQLPDSLAK